MAAPMMPGAFADLEPFAEQWCLATEAERYAARLSSTMDEMESFYAAAMPRTDAAKAHLDGFPLDELPDDALNLLHLLYSLICISFAVECWKQPNVPDSGAAYLDLVKEPVP
jgi:hypothetical protein